MTIPILGGTPFPFMPYSNIQPFSARAGSTYLEVLEQLRGYIRDELTPYLDSQYTALAGNWAEQVDQMILAVSTTIGAQSTAVTEQLSAQDAEFSLKVAAQELAINETISAVNGVVDGRISALETSVNLAVDDMETLVLTTVSDITNSTIAVSDPVIVGVFNNLTSQFRLAVRAFVSGYLGADPLDYGATATADSAAAFNSAAVASKMIHLRPGAIYRLTTAVTLPAGTTVNGNGATIQLLTQGSLILNDDSAVRNVKMLNGNVSGFIGGEVAINIQGQNVTVENCLFTGSDYRHGITIIKAGGGSCDFVTIRNNTFRNTAYGILKQGGPTGTPTTAHSLRITGNRFNTVRKADAIELNAGSDRDILVDSNIIDDVTQGTNTNAGFGIAVAGLTGYAATEDDRFRRCIISNNIITNTEKEAIHAEVASHVDILNNHLEQILPERKATATGIIVYGSINCTVSGNNVFGYAVGLADSIGFLGVNIISTDRNKFAYNNVTNCTTGLIEGVSGEGKTAFITNNTFTGCVTGVLQSGASSGVFHTGNIFLSCPKPFQIDGNPSGKLAIAASTKRIVFKNNQAYSLDGTTPTNTYANMAGTTVGGEGNTFVIPASI